MTWATMPPALKFIAIKVAWNTRSTQGTLARALKTTRGAIASMYRRHPSLKVTHALARKNVTGLDKIGILIAYREGAPIKEIMHRFGCSQGRPSQIAREFSVSLRRPRKLSGQENLPVVHRGQADRETHLSVDRPA